MFREASLKDFLDQVSREKVGRQAALRYHNWSLLADTPHGRNSSTNLQSMLNSRGVNLQESPSRQSDDIQQHFYNNDESKNITPNLKNVKKVFSKLKSDFCGIPQASTRHQEAVLPQSIGKDTDRYSDMPQTQVVVMGGARSRLLRV